MLFQCSSTATFRDSRLGCWQLQAFDWMYAQIEKSRGLRSGELGGHISARTWCCRRATTGRTLRCGRGPRLTSRWRCHRYWSLFGSRGGREASKSSLGTPWHPSWTQTWGRLAAFSSRLKQLIQRPWFEPDVLTSWSTWHDLWCNGYYGCSRSLVDGEELLICEEDVGRIFLRNPKKFLTTLQSKRLETFCEEKSAGSGQRPSPQLVLAMFQIVHSETLRSLAITLIDRTEILLIQLLTTLVTFLVMTVGLLPNPGFLLTCPQSL